MKKFLWFMVLSVFLFQNGTTGQTVKGIIYADTSDILVVKLWGSHQERGYALGYLTGDKITDIIVNYIKPQFGSFYNTARNLIIQGNDLTIAQEYMNEAQSIIDGMNAAATNTSGLDKTDILVGNTFLDVSNLLFMNAGMNCSVLMSWNDATSGTELDGKSVITRHLDWTYSPVLIRNHIIIVHFPSEPDESKWLLTGFSGMMSVLSGFNPDFSAFQNMMDDFTAFGVHGKHYIPIWFALRRALEKSDYNNDGVRNVLDVRSSLSDCSTGFADGFIISSLARSNPVDSLVALVAELAPAAPLQTYRSSAFPDSIPGDNLYTANYQIARNHAMHFCSRYNAVRAHIGNGTNIGLDTSWNLMRDYSHLSTNTQFMQYAPEADYFRISVYRNGKPAYMNDPVVFNLTDLFYDPTTGISGVTDNPGIFINPNPTRGITKVKSQYPVIKFSILNSQGIIVQTCNLPASTNFSLDFSAFPQGIYFVQFFSREGNFISKVIRF